MGYAKYREDDMDIMLERQTSRVRKISKSSTYEEEKPVFSTIFSKDLQKKDKINKL